MKTFIKSMSQLLDSLREHPERCKEIAEMIKTALNTTFTDISCKKVFISHGNDCNPYVVTVIPNIPRDNILLISNIKNYDIDIDLDSLFKLHKSNGFYSHEIVAWLIHELLANVITDETLLRYKKLLVKYYDTNNTFILDAIRSIGRLLWIGIFSRTKKNYIDDDDTTRDSAIDSTMRMYDLADEWNSALAKYICNYGGHNSILTDEYMERMDKTQLREFNELARKYSSYVLKYNNTDYSTMIKYIIASSNSKLVEHYCKKEPDQILIFDEKDVYNLFDDRKLLMEGVVDNEMQNAGLSRLTSFPEIQAKYNEIEIDLHNINTESDKINIAVRLKDLMREISDSIVKDNFCDHKEIMSLTREKCMKLLDKLNKIEANKQLSVVEIDGLPSI